MAQGVYTRQKRFTFVEKDISEVGDGTAFPMQATLRQIAELFYRVKDARFTAGSANWTLAGNITSIKAPSSAPPNRAYQDDTLNLLTRGYTFEGNDPFNDALYDIGSGSMYSDISDRESGILRGIYNANPPITNAFSFYSNNDQIAAPPSPDYWFYAYEDLMGAYDGANASVIFNGEISVIKVNPADSMYASTNTFYIGLEFQCFDFAFIPNGGSTNKDLYGFTDNVCSYVIRLSSGDIACPFYVSVPPYDSVSGSDFIHEATEWFPYAAGIPAAPVWDSTTGVRL